VDQVSPRNDREALGHPEKRIWKPNPSALESRRARREGAYEVFIPARIAERRFSLGDDAVTAIVSATKALAHLNSSEPRLASLNALATSLLRSESAASSRIEDLAISHKRLARAAYKKPGRPGDRATEVLGNVEAMRRAIELGAGRTPITVDDIRDVHRTLLRFSVDRKIAGVIRQEQNWIGGNDFNPLGAVYVPPPPEHVRPLLEDFCRFVARDDLAPIAQAAIAHAQFENIHPFADGNGRVGRALIHAILRRRGEAVNYISPISLVLAGEQRDYIAGFGAYSTGDVSSWCEVFADAVEQAAHEVERMAAQIEDRQASWLERLGNPRRDAVVRQLVSLLPEQPVIDVAGGQRLTGRSHVSVQNALKQLEEAGILRRLNERKWGRVWECAELLELVEDFEEAVSSPR
jgi:Fic family protein